MNRILIGLGTAAGAFALAACGTSAAATPAGSGTAAGAPAGGGVAPASDRKSVV